MPKLLLWRTLIAKAVGVTLSDEGAAWANAHNPGPEYVISDYRDMPENDEKKFHAISCIEMAEHVGLENFQVCHVTEAYGTLHEWK